MKKARSGLSGGIFYLGLALIGVLAIPAALLLVFFLPLLFAGLHLGFAFPFIHKMLVLFNLTDLKLLIGTTVITFAVYAVFYAIVYRVTSNSYYAIVAGAKEDAA